MRPRLESRRCFFNIGCVGGSGIRCIWSGFSEPGNVVLPEDAARHAHDRPDGAAP